ncbi:MAG: chloride channel protein [Calditrichaeota bacterium]|nr:chloride channel protein [Calditrichota bacterium]
MSRQRRLIVDALFLGVVGALSAQIFMFLLHLAQKIFLIGLAGYHPPGLPEEGGVLQQAIGPHGLWLIPVATTLGGLLSGLLVYTFAPEAEGHGTDTAVKAFHRTAGFIRNRVAPLKAVASAITIGSGGAAGREGPTALISAGVGSTYATLTHRSDEDRRLLVLIGMAAGLSAIFRSPIGTAFFAIEVLYGNMEFEAGALLYTLLASVVAYTVNGLFVGWQPLFSVPANLAVPGFADYFAYAGLGLVAGIVAAAVPMIFYGLRDAFHAIPLPPHVKPALGGLGVGLLALAWPQVLGGGYGWIQEAMDGHLALKLLFALVFLKMIAFALTVSSGGSGGVFAPTLFVGAMLGGGLALVFHQPSAPFVIVGMAALFGGAARVPIATLLMVTEMTGGYHFFVPAALAVTVSYFIQVLLSSRLKYRSLYEAQVPGRPDSAAHHRYYLETALRILREDKDLALKTKEHLDLRRLLAAGVPVDLPDGRQIVLGKLRSGSEFEGKTIGEVLSELAAEDSEIVAVFRDGHTLLPHEDLVLEAGDSILAIVPAEGRARLEGHLTPLGSEQDSQLSEAVAKGDQSGG